jgi:hypothetical protein
MADSHEVQRRDFINIVLVGLGSVIGLIIGIPAIAYLLSPAVKVHEEEAWIPLLVPMCGAMERGSQR